MSDETTPDNIVNLPDQQGEPTPAAETPAPEPQADAAPQDPVAEVLSKIDWDTINADDVFLDIITASRQFSMRLMIGSAVMEQILVRKQQAEGTTAA